MNSFDQAIASLYDLQKTGMKFGLRNIRILLKALGNPQNAFKSIHIAGSNGKGSTAAMIASILSAAGYRTGLYTSPHLISFSERIRVNGRPIAPRDIVRISGKLWRSIERNRVTFFEATTAIAFQYFQEQHVDIAVIETGLGGRLDATNVISPLACVITNIDLEHTHILGNSLGQIAYEKAGILKAGTPCCIGVTSRSALEVIEREAQKKKAPIYHSNQLSVTPRRSTLKGSIIDVTGRGTRLSKVSVDLAGSIQIENAKLAIMTIAVLRNRKAVVVSNAALRRGLNEIRKRTGFYARLSVVRQRPRTIVDVAHNQAAMAALVRELSELGMKDITVVFGVMKDKRYRAMIRLLRTIIVQAVVVQPKTERAVPAAQIVKEFKRHLTPVLFKGSVAEGIRTARGAARPSGTVLVTGSHFVVGEALAALDGKNYLTINQ